MARIEASLREEEEIRAVENEAKRVSRLHQKTESRRFRRTRLPESVGEINLPSEPFLYHANFWARAPRRYGKGRGIAQRAKLWDDALLKAKNSGWMRNLVRGLGVTTVGKLSLWSAQQLRKVAGVPQDVATRIVQLMSLLKRELQRRRWRIK